MLCDSLSLVRVLGIDLLPGELLKHAPRAIGDLLIRLPTHGMAGLLLEERETCGRADFSSVLLRGGEQMKDGKRVVDGKGGVEGEGNTNAEREMDGERGREMEMDVDVDIPLSP